ncbi:MAG: hypothetical protein ACD_12C00853G0002 [uncultured bacterium]|nr:MAG: hypothetical protein ACD_12C00853G0002 [uncultured bacterium]
MIRKGRTKVLFKRLNSKIGKPAKPIWGKIKDITAKKDAIEFLNNVFARFQIARKVINVAKK